ncbi:MAG: hypothetical protein ABSF91_13000 [Bacteroidota bacterium]|jgi:hypothetical protein
MGIKARIEDALFLWQNGRKEGAFLSALVAVASTARRIYSDRKAVGVREAFEQFLTASNSIRISVEYRGELYTIEHIFYKWLRCELVHEGGLPTDIEFTPDAEPGALSVRAGGAPQFVLKLSESWFHFLINSVIYAPINSDQFRPN